MLVMKMMIVSMEVMRKRTVSENAKPCCCKYVVMPMMISEGTRSASQVWSALVTLSSIQSEMKLWCSSVKLKLELMALVIETRLQHALEWPYWKVFVG